MKFGSAEKIYATENTARLVASTLTKHKGVPHIFEKVATGYRVAPQVEVAVEQPAPVKKKLVIVKGTGETLMVTLDFIKEGAYYIDAYLPNGKLASFGKPTLVSWGISGGKVNLEMSKAVAKRRGLI